MASMENVGPNIAAMWKHHYSTIFNSVPNSCCAKAHDDIFNNTNIVFDNEINVNVEEMKTIVNGLACNKSPGLDGVSPEHMKFAGPKLCVGPTYVYGDIVYLYSRFYPQVYDGIGYCSGN